MQYLRECINGERVSVDEWTWRMDMKEKSYRQILATPGCVIYRMGKTRRPEKPLAYGGRSNGMKADHCWNGA